MSLRLLSLTLLAASSCALVKGPPKDGECRANLRSVLALEHGFFQEHQRFSVHPAELGFSLPAGNRYLYRLAPEGPVTRRDGTPSPPPLESVGLGPDTLSRGVTAEWLDERLPPEVRATLGLHGACPACAITIGCVANLDADDDVDVWSISSDDRALPDGGLAPRGTALRHRDDQVGGVFWRR